MTTTHLSHYGLQLVATTADNVVLAGSLADCKRMAAAHGMDIQGYEGCILGAVGGIATYQQLDAARPNRIVYVGGGMIQRGRDDYSLVMPRAVWNQKL